MRATKKMSTLKTLMLIVFVLAALQLQTHCNCQLLGIKPPILLKKSHENTNNSTEKSNTNELLENLRSSSINVVSGTKNITETTVDKVKENNEKLDHVMHGLIDWSKSSIEDVIIKAKCIIPKDANSITRAALLQQCLSPSFGYGNETRCFGELGCFTMDNPWISFLRPFPMPMKPDEIQTKLYMYTRNTPERYNVSLWPEISIKGSDFDANRPHTVFITHGFSSDGNNSWLSDLKDSYLKNRDANVFLVDWGKGASSANYLQVASNTRIVGAELARFGKYLAKQQGLDPSKIHLMGHSLGAHISSYFAKNFPGVGRITAFDPAQPGFEGCPKEVRLDKSDAEFVDVIHTSCRPTVPFLGFGLIEPVGHVDVYMNGGLIQPGCTVPPFNTLKITGIADLAAIPVNVLSSWVACSHGRSYQYFIESVWPIDICTFWGRKTEVLTAITSIASIGQLEPITSLIQKCKLDECIPLGLDADQYPGRGVFSAATAFFSPFCRESKETDELMRSELRNSRNAKNTLYNDDDKKSNDNKKGILGLNFGRLTEKNNNDNNTTLSAKSRKV